ncbi:MAG: D-alanine--D-alanine ligase [Candidatus Omnitrophota bacterium]
MIENIKNKIREFGRIGVLLGGPSSEREISLRSGNAVCEALRGGGYDIVAIDPNSSSLSDNAAGFIKEIRDANITVAFIALHGKFGEDGTVQKILELTDIPYTGSEPLASRLALDKISSRRVFESAGINVPQYRVFRRNQGLPPDVMKYPVVVKPAMSGSSIGLSVVKKQDALKEALDAAFQHDEWVIIEQYVDGREVTVGILDDEPLPVIEIIPKEKIFDYHAKYTPDATEYVVPALLERRLYQACQKAGLAAHKALDCRSFSRVDMIIDTKNNTPVVLEVNTIPGLTAISLLPKAAKAAGVDFLQLCEKLIYSAINSYENKTSDACAQKEIRT